MKQFSQALFRPVVVGAPERALALAKKFGAACRLVASAELQLQVNDLKVGLLGVGVDFARTF